VRGLPVDYRPTRNELGSILDADRGSELDAD